MLVAAALMTGAALLVVPTPASAASKPNLVGTWTGPYSFPSGTDQVVPSVETLVIVRQTGLLVWGHDDYSQNGQQLQIPLRGTVDSNGHDFTLAEQNGFFRGTLLTATKLDVRFTRTDNQYTSFEAVLRRSG